MLDATVTPADIKYPTDIGLLNQVRKETEKIIDIFHKCRKEKSEKKPKTYRNKARKDYLAVVKKRRISRKERRKAVKKQLQYIKRNRQQIDNFLEKGVGLEELSHRQYRRFLIANEIYRQQEWMWSNNSDRIDNRIVSLTQPHVRPIVRGKAGANVEFGAKISASYFDGHLFLNRVSWDNYNESGDLQAQVEAYKAFTGYYPESVHVDKIYRTRANHAWCKARGIRMSGASLGRPKNNPSQQEKKQAREDEKIRNRIEGKFGQSKRRFSLNRVMTKLSHTSETAIAIAVLVMNLVTLLRQVFCVSFSKKGTFLTRTIIFLYQERIFYHLQL